jgi:hypothetical protein
VEALLALFRFLVPYFAGTDDADVQAALTAAAGYRPECLTPAQQDNAQVWYAAWLLYERQMQVAATLPENAIPYGVKSEKEGDLQRTYGAVEQAADGPLDFWGKYANLARMCGGAITVGHRYGSCCRQIAGY